MITQEVIKRCEVHGKKRSMKIVYKLRQFAKENAVLIRMSNEIEEKPLPGVSGCRNVTCSGGKIVGEKIRVKRI